MQVLPENISALNHTTQECQQSTFSTHPQGHLCNKYSVDPVKVIITDQRQANTTLIIL